MNILVIQHSANEGPGLLEDKLKKKGLKMDIKRMDRWGEKVPGNLHGYDSFLIMGGLMGAYEEEKYPYLYKVQDLIRLAADQGIPTVGICLGGQLIARALGAEVRPNAVKEIGWYPISLTLAGQSALVFAGLPERISVFQWHQDTFSLPEGAVGLARGITCINQAFVYKEVIWGLQFHPEVNLKIIKRWADVGVEEIEEIEGPGGTRKFLEKTLIHWGEMSKVRDTLLNNLEKVLYAR